MAASARAAGRALRLLELFARRQSRLVEDEVARALEMTSPAAATLLASLAALDYLHYDPADRTYAPTMRVALLGGWLGPCRQGGRSLAARLDDLHADTGEDVFVGIQNGAAVQIVQGRGPSHRLSIDLGRMFSLTRTSVGQALLAGKPDPDVVTLVRRANAAADLEEEVDEAALLATLAAVRRNGYASQHGYHWADRGAVAVRIASADGPDFAVGCGGPSPRIASKQSLIVERLRALEASYRAAPPGPRQSEPAQEEAREAWLPGQVAKQPPNRGGRGRRLVPLREGGATPKRQVAGGRGDGGV